MRRFLPIALAALLAVPLAAVPAASHAQYGGPGAGAGPGGGGGDDEEDQDAARKKRQEKEWGENAPSLPGVRNAGPCPFVKTLYDAARYVEFKDNREASSNVAWSGEIQGISAGCRYKGEEPIHVALELLFELGKGPQAGAGSKTYRYWVAVTDRNHSVIAKQTFNLPVTFPAGQDRVYVTEKINQVMIPRATAVTSGANFEILVGFEVTPQMADFNRDGKRFRLNAGVQAAGAAAQTQ